MQKAWNFVIGIVLVMCGATALATNLVLPALGVSTSWIQPWSIWPLFILALGSVLLLMALFSIRNPGWGALFIPALPVITVGGMLILSTVFGYWHLWSFAWPFIILSLAVGFLLAAVFMRNVWLGIPAIIIGVNAVVLTFCSLTGLWDWWAFLWTVEPLALGLIFLLISFKTRSGVMMLLALLTCGFALFAFSVMTGFMIFGDWAFRMAAPALLILTGILLLSWGSIRRIGSPARE